MKNSFLIWIPSIQNYLRFSELTNNQYRGLLKVLDDLTEVEFFYQLNQTIKDNLITPFDVDLLTTIDRFIICVFLKMYSCSSHISLTRVCEKCKNSSTINLDLSKLIPVLAPKIDKKFSTVIQYEMYKCLVDIPTIKTEYEIFENSLLKNEDKTSLDNVYDNYIISHIKTLDVNNSQIDFNALDLKTKKLIFSKLPAGLVDNIRNEFLTPIHESLADISFMDMSCAGCKEKFDLKFQINFISDLIKIIFKDNSIGSLMMDVYNLGSAAHIDPNFLMQISPMEMGILVDYAKEVNKQKSENKNEKQIDLFETPSEFT